MIFKAAAVLLLLGVAAVRADDPPTVSAALNDLPVSEFFNSLKQFPDLLEMVGPNFAGTVFAPTNKGWKYAVAGMRSAGLPLTTDSLEQILRYHIIPGPPAPITGLNDDQIFVSALGAKTVVAQYTDGALTLEGIGSDAHVVAADIHIGPAHYGVVHTIDSILLPFKLPNGKSLPAPGDKAQGTVSATDLISDVTGAVSSAVNSAEEAASSAVNSAEAAANQAANTAQEAANSAQDAASQAANAAQQAANDAVQAGQQAAAGAVDAAQGAAAAAGDAASGAAGAAADAANQAAGAVDGAVGDAVDAVDGATGAVAGAVTGAVAGAEAPTMATSPSAGPTAAPTPEAAPGPSAAPDAMAVPPSSAAAASLKTVAMALFGLVLLLA